MNNDKHDQLGMNSSTASARLLKDILFNFIKDVPCYRCGEKLTREAFSIDHKENWLHSADPIGLFFNLENISYSHLNCNSRAKRYYQIACPSVASYDRGCRCAKCININQQYKRDRKRKNYDPRKRREKYLKLGY